jgi:hypothetical protein
VLWASLGRQPSSIAGARVAPTLENAWAIPLSTVSPAAANPPRMTSTFHVQELNMIRSSILAIGALSFFVVGGCENAADQQLKANVAQHDANKEVYATNTDCAAKNKSSQADADAKISDAQASFMKMREDYRHSTVVNLASLDESITGIEAKDKKATGKAKMDIDTSLSSIRTNRARFLSDYGELELEPAVTWDGAKSRLDAEFGDLRALVDHS